MGGHRTEAGELTVLLIMEDGGLMSRTLREFIEGAVAGCKVVQARDAAGSTGTCSPHYPQAALMDLRLPDPNGPDVIAAIEAALADVCVVPVSSLLRNDYADSADMPRAMAYVAREDIHRHLLADIGAALTGPREDAGGNRAWT